MGKKKIQSANADRIKKSGSKKIFRKLIRGRAYLKATYNNTIITITDESGNPIAQSSAGALGFKGAKKATPYAATSIVEDLKRRLETSGIKELNVYVNGVGTGRDAAIRALAGQGYDILMIKDLTPVPHNGCRPPKARRV